MAAKLRHSRLPPGAVGSRGEHGVRVRFRAPFALRCGALLVDYIMLALILTLSTLVARLMGGGARMAGGTAQKIGILITIVVALLDLGLLAGLTGKTIGKWTTGLSIERTDGGLPGIGRALLRHFVGYPLSLLPFGLGFLIVTVSPTGRALHDLIAGTIVVRPQAPPLAAPVRKPRPQGA